jgi:hypothetical protein
MESGRKVPLAVLPVPSTMFTGDGVSTVFEGGTLTVGYQYPLSGGLARGGLRFNTVRAYRWRAESHCEAWHIDGAYDTLIEVEDSGWVTELLMAEPKEIWGHWMLRHFMIFVDSYGCLEAVADVWEFTSTELVA